MKKATAITGGLIAAAAIALGVYALTNKKGAPTQAGTETLRVGVATQATSLDPAHAVDTVSGNILSQIMTPLYSRNPQGKIIPAMATKVVSPTHGGKTYTFTLRQDVRFSNGDPVTAQDFVYSIRRIVDPATKTEFAYQYDNILNYADIQAGKKAPNTLGISAPSKYTLQIELSQPTPYFDGQLTGYYPTSEKAVKQYGAKFGSSAATVATNGAYRIKNFDVTSDSWDYEKDPQYFDAKSVRIPRVHVQVVKDAATANMLFSSGKLQDVGITGTMIKKNAGNKALVKTPVANMNYLQLNTKKATLNNANLRLAISYALDRKDITDRILQDGSQPAQAFVPKGLITDPTTGKDFVAATTAPIGYSPTKARAYLATALKELGVSTISFNILTSDVEADRQVGQYMQAQLEKILPALTVTTSSVPKQTRIQRSLDGDFEAVLMSWNSAIEDASDYLNTATATNISNFSRFSDPTFTDLMNQVNNTANQTPEQRVALEVKANDRVVDVAGYIPVFQSANDRLIAQNVTGLTYTIHGNALYKDAAYK